MQYANWLRCETCPDTYWRDDPDCFVCGATGTPTRYMPAIAGGGHYTAPRPAETAGVSS